MTDERRPDGSDPDSPDASEWLASQFGADEPDSDEVGDEAQDPGAPAGAAPTAPIPTVVPARVTPPAASPVNPNETNPIVPRRLPSAASFFGEPRPPRHSAHVDPEPAPSSAPELAPESASAPTPPPTQSAEPQPVPVTEEPTRATGSFALPPTAPAEGFPAAPVSAFRSPSAATGPDVSLVPAAEEAAPTEPPVAPTLSPAPAAPTAPSSPVAPTAPTQNALPEAVALPPVEAFATPAEPATPPVSVAPPAPAEPGAPVSAAAESDEAAASPHPMALDLSALRGQASDVDVPDGDEAEPAPWSLTGEQPSFDVGRLPAHDENGATPTAAFGAVFGQTPTAPVEVVPSAGIARDEAAPIPPVSEPDRPETSEPSFTELISLPAHEVLPSSEPASFDWSTLPAAAPEVADSAVSLGGEPQEAFEISPPPASGAPAEVPPQVDEPESFATQAFAVPETAPATPPETQAFAVPEAAPATPPETAPLVAEATPPTAALPVPTHESTETQALDLSGDAAAAALGAAAASGAAADESRPSESTFSPDDDTPTGPPITPWWVSDRSAAEADAAEGVVPGAANDAEVEPDTVGDLANPPASMPTPVPAPTQTPADEPSAEAEPTFTEILGVVPEPTNAAEQSAEVWHLLDDEDQGDFSPAHAAPDSDGEPQPFLPAPTATPVEHAAIVPPAVEPFVEDQPFTDPVAALFGEAGFVVDDQAVDEPTPATAAFDAPDADSLQGSDAEHDSSWADVPREPIPLALAPESDAAPVDPAVAAETAEFTALAAPEPTASEPAPSASTEAPAAEAAAASAAAVAAEQARSAASAEGTTLPPTQAMSVPLQPERWDPPPRRPRSSESTPATGILPSPPESTPAPSAAPRDAGRESTPSNNGGGFGSSPRDRRILLYAGIGVAFVIVLIVLFFFGKAIATNAADVPSAVVPTTTSSHTPSVAPSKSPSAAPAVPATPAAPAASGPAAPGTHPWSDLHGGECLSSFQNAWQQTYDVVDCATPHAAQLVSTGALAGAAGSAFPGVKALDGLMGARCQGPSAINLGAAKAYSDIQVSASYPATADQWATGARSYYCFVNRSGGGPLTGSLAA